MVVLCVSKGCTLIFGICDILYCGYGLQSNCIIRTLSQLHEICDLMVYCLSGLVKLCTVFCVLTASTLLDAGPGAVGSTGNTPSSKTRHTEAGGRSARGGRATGDLQAAGQADGKNETVVSDGKSQGSKQARENGDSNMQGYAVPQQLVTEDRRKLDITLNESGIYVFHYIQLMVKRCG